MTGPPETGTTPQRLRDAWAADRRLGAADRGEFVSAYIAQERMARRRRPVPAWLARRAARRALALAAALPLLLHVAAGTIDEPDQRFGPPDVLALAGMALFVACLLLLRRATAVLTEAPESLLDERERDERGSAYVRAYPLLAALLVLVTLLHLVNEGGWVFSEAGFRQVLIGSVYTAALLPWAVTAWRWRDLPD